MVTTGNKPDRHYMQMEIMLKLSKIVIETVYFFRHITPPLDYSGTLQTWASYRAISLSRLDKEFEEPTP